MARASTEATRTQPCQRDGVHRMQWAAVEPPAGCNEKPSDGRLQCRRNSFEKKLLRLYRFGRQFLFSIVKSSTIDKAVALCRGSTYFYFRYYLPLGTCCNWTCFFVADGHTTLLKWTGSWKEKTGFSISNVEASRDRCWRVDGRTVSESECRKCSIFIYGGATRPGQRALAELRANAEAERSQ